VSEAFSYRADVLHCADVPLTELAEAVGTPLYVYSAERMRANVERVRAAFAPLGATLHYSLKANANLALLRLLHSLDLGADAVSGGEIERAIYAGFPPQRIVFAGVGKTPAELAYALDVGVGWFNVESRDELRTLDRLAGERGVRPNVALRLNPGIRAQTHAHIATGHLGAKFGMAAEVVAELLAERAAYPHVHIGGLHIHIGSQLADVAETVQAVRAAQALAAPYADVRVLNVGGGIPVPYRADAPLPTPQDFADALAPLLRGWRVKLEPGRSVVADAGALLVSVIRVKRQGGRRFVVTDGSMAELLRPALYGAQHPIVPLRRSEKATEAAAVVGPVCESTDVLSQDAPLPPLRAGDGLAVLVAGAYGMVMASNYNMRPRPPEVLVEGARWRVVRRRETWADLRRLEVET